ncbi:MAG: DNA double-strand break repair nuclease NurA, partial [Thermoplasmata archaeon]|nr:DNA double-strand break repair nuclease NurA [Thermoplasmata archaeon]NIY02612.1 DNA double-strand break repair nuclease NurA [Thermoplasmata archaeon]
MLSADAKRKLLEEVQEFSLPFDHRKWSEEAGRSFSTMKLDGEVRSLTPLGYESAPVLELASRGGPFERVLGLDGGSTRPIHFSDGSTLCANQAVVVSEPQMELERMPLEAFRTLALLSHSFAASGGPQAEYREEGLVGLWRVHITRDYLRRDVDHVVKGLADSASEARHARRMAARLSLGKDDLLILDGNIFPIGLYYYLIGEGNRFEIDLVSNGGAITILEGHLRLAELAAEQGAAYVGINKTPRTRYLLNCLHEEGPWAEDRQFIRALFWGLPKDELGWTNWFIQRRYRAYLSSRGP